MVRLKDIDKTKYAVPISSTEEPYNGRNARKFQFHNGSIKSVIFEGNEYDIVTPKQMERQST
jgi:hypothetical protein